MLLTCLPHAVPYSYVQLATFFAASRVLQRLSIGVYVFPSKACVADSINLFEVPNTTSISKKFQQKKMYQVNKLIILSKPSIFKGQMFLLFNLVMR